MQDRSALQLGATLGGVEAQTLACASETLPGLTVPIRPLPFRYESTGVETFFTHGRYKQKLQLFDLPLNL